ncbi:MAG: hypothetical protein HYV07_31825 [Deltaproteobacteria bacterium]|nr:hypothetical protein [Deltaproteobacteria bacterium]
MEVGELVVLLRDAAGDLAARGLVVSGPSAAHVHLIVATGSSAGEPAKYAALPPRTIHVLGGTVAPTNPFTRDSGHVAEVLAANLALFTTSVRLAEGTRLSVLTREAVLAQLLERGGLAVGLAGLLVKLTRNGGIDVDEIRELLKAARESHRFQPMLELLDLAQAGDVHLGDGQLRPDDRDPQGNP